MKIRVISLSLCVAHAIFGQEIRKAIPVDEFGPIKCDDILARIDNFSIQLNNNRTARGIVVISGSNPNLIKKLSLEVLFTSGSIQRRAETSRVRVIRGAETGEPVMRFWLVPAGADEPDVAATVWDMTISPKTKPFYFFADSDAICFYPTLNKYIKELLMANPGLRVNVVINARTSKEFRHLRNETIEIYSPEFSKRLRFFHVRNSYPDSYREYWIVP